MKQFFLFCSGVNIPLLRKAPSEEVKYAGIGATVFFTGLFASISGGYALYFIFNDIQPVARVIAALVFGFLWGAMIFNLDRYIVSSMKKGNGFWNEAKLAIPRLLLAMVIAVVISKPLELQIFHTSIEYELETMKQEELKRQELAVTGRFQDDINSMNNQLKLLQAEVDAKTVQRDKLDEEARKEADGSGGSQRRGTAEIYNVKKADAVKAQQELNETTTKNKPLMDSMRTAIAARSQAMDSSKTAIKRGEYTGFDKRLDALGRVTSRSNTISLASFFVMLLFVCIEIAPVLVKLLSPKGPYDDLLEKHEHAVEMYKMEEMSKTSHKTHEKLRVMADSAEDIIAEKVAANKDLNKKTIAADRQRAEERLRR